MLSLLLLKVSIRKINNLNHILLFVAFADNDDCTMHQYKPCKCNHKTFLSLNKKCRRLDSAWTWTKNNLKLIDSLPKESPESTQNGNTHSDTITENVSVRQSADSPADKNDASCSSKDAEILCNITSQKSIVIQNTINTNAVHKIFPCKLFKLPKWKHLSQQTEIHTFCRSTQTHAKIQSDQNTQTFRTIEHVAKKQPYSNIRIFPQILGLS